MLESPAHRTHGRMMDNAGVNVAEKNIRNALLVSQDIGR